MSPGDQRLLKRMYDKHFIMRWDDFVIGLGAGLAVDLYRSHIKYILLCCNWQICSCTNSLIQSILLVIFSLHVCIGFLCSLVLIHQRQLIVV